MHSGFSSEFSTDRSRPLHEQGEGDTVSLAIPRSIQSDKTHLETLKLFNDAGQALLLERLDFLQSLGKFIAKDFAVPILLNEPGKGWHWNFIENVIRVDPVDLLTKSLDFQRFVVAHEGAHRRITRFDLIPSTLLKQPGYGFMSNAIEDPRINNFIIASYKRLSLCVDAVYGEEEEKKAEAQKLAREQLGYTPLFVLAGLEYISQWYQELSGAKGALNPSLPSEVRACVEKTLDAARSSWEHYPSQDELEAHEGLSTEYQQRSHDINREKIWPEFRKLVERDLENQKVQELLQELEREMFEQRHNEWDRPKTPIQDKMKQKLSQGEASDLKDRVEDKSWGSPIPLDELSERVREKLAEIFDELPREKQAKLEEKAEQSLKDFEGVLAEALDQLQVGDGDGEVSIDSFLNAPHSQKSSSSRSGDTDAQAHPFQTDPDSYSEEVHRAPQGSKVRYEQIRRQVHRESQHLDQELRRIFRERKRNQREAEHRSGREIDLGKRIREIAKDVHPLQSRAWERKESPLERDYAITLLLDQTSSMSGEKMKEAAKALLMMTEPLQKLGIRFEILGFNSRLNVYKEFREQFDDRARERLGDVEGETGQEHSGNTDDGWAVDMASRRLEGINARQKFLIVVTDGFSNPSAPHAHPFYNIDEVLSRIELRRDQRVVGVGIGDRTNVDSHYSNGISGVEAKDLAKALSKILQEIVEHER